MPNEDTASKKVTFIQYAQPQLEDGNYRLTVNQKVSSKSSAIPETLYQNEKGFTIRGERFALNPSDIVSVFPPEFSLGEFSNVLPHVILAKKTQPWERSLGAQAQVNDAPWLGVIVFDEGDPIPQSFEATILDLLPASGKTNTGATGQLPVGTYFSPFPLDATGKYSVLDFGESWSDKCQAVDIDASLFNKLMPTVSDLAWLAHVREVDITSKPETYIRRLKASTKDTGSSVQLSEVVSNRFPLPGKKSVAHLVCLEGFGEVLPGEDGISNLPKGTENVRLVSLRSWTFTAISEQFTFAGLLENVNKVHGTFSQNVLTVPFTATGSQTGDAAVSNALKMGFTAFNHRTRMGDKTVSWFHGPFVAFDNQTTIDFPGNTADELTRYNPDSGMFDLTYASAWQLGKLLGLQSNSFATALYNWKRSLKTAVIRQVENGFINLSYAQIAALVKETLNNYVDPLNGTGRKAMPQALFSKKPVATEKSGSHKATANVIQKITAVIFLLIRWLVGLFYQKGTRPTQLTPEPVSRLHAVRQALADPQKITQLLGQNDNLPEVPFVIANFVARLKLLYGVPFNYLVPDPRMLPQESLRFFYLDSAWVDALAEGALNIGSSTSAEAAVGRAFARQVHQQARATGGNIRKGLVGAPLSDDSPIVPLANPTGFLLRSQVVSGWPGMEAHGFDSQGNKLNLLRFDQIGPGVLLCIFDGVVQQVILQEHPEALHFGVDMDIENPAPDHFSKSFRYIVADGTHEPGAPVPTSVAPPLGIPAYARTTSSVLNIDKLATDMGAKLKEKIQYSGPFTSAEFALEMIEGVQQITFTFNKTNQKSSN